MTNVILCLPGVSDSAWPLIGVFMPVSTPSTRIFACGLLNTWRYPFVGSTLSSPDAFVVVPVFVVPVFVVSVFVVAVVVPVLDVSVFVGAVVVPVLAVSVLVVSVFGVSV